jgi:NAD(P)-dependent dehydrogenase (short-subunit alcohol dehydrogenase family)
VQRAGFIDLGLIKGNIGDQNYHLGSDVDLSRYRAVSVWCKRFRINFGTAALSADHEMSREQPDFKIIEGVMDKKLGNKVAVVTGGSAGIGLGVAERFAAEGAQVFVTGRRQSELDKAAAEIDGKVVALRGDTSNLSDIDRIYKTVKEQAGRIDILFANAAFYEVGKLGEITEEHFDKTFNTNVRGLLFAVQKALPILSRGSSVILVGSIASIKGFEALSVYDASKAAVRSFARGWIIDLKGRGIRVNVLSPGHIDTPGLSALMTDEQKVGVVANVPLGRLGTPDDMAKAALFLASDDSSYVNGVELFADGGVAQY